MNRTEHLLDEVEVEQWRLKEMVSALLHTILFVRAPGPCRPAETFLERFDKAHATCGLEDINRTVEESIDGLMNSLVERGPELGWGCLTLSFFERRVTKQLFGLVNNEEQVVGEQWKIPVLGSTTPRPVGDDAAWQLERQRQAVQAEAVLQVGAQRNGAPPVWEHRGGRRRARANASCGCRPLPVVREGAADADL